MLVLALSGHGSTIQSVPGSDDSEIEFLQNFLAVVFLHWVAGGLMYAA